MKQVLGFITTILSVGIFSIIGYAENTIITGHLGGGPIEYDTIPNWDTAVSVPHSVTGIDTHTVGVTSCKATINVGDASLIDIAECHYHLQGPEYEMDAATGIDPGFGAGENSAFIGVTLNGYTTQEAAWTAVQKQTIIPIARLNTASGDLGPGSDVFLVRDDRYFASERDYRDRLWTEEAIGSLYATGGELFSNATSSLVMAQNAGVLFNPQRERHTLSAFGNMSALFVHYSSNDIPIAIKAPFLVDNQQYDDGATGLNTILANRWTNISVLKSPQGANGVQEGGWFYIYGNEYTTQAGAEAADFDFGPFVSQGASGLVPLATVIVKKDGITLDTDLFIIDKRACLVCRP